MQAYHESALDQIGAAIAQFTKDFAGLVGEDKTMADC